MSSYPPPPPSGPAYPPDPSVVPPGMYRASDGNVYPLHPPPAPPPKSSSTKILLIVGGVLAGLCLLGIIAAAIGGNKANEELQTVATGPTVTTIAPTTALALTTTVAPTTTVAATTLPPATVPATASAPATVPGTRRMPAIPCGTDLQAAQDQVQSEAGIFKSRSQDATGQGRLQVIDRNWTVISHSPSAGTPITEDQPVFSVVKDEEFSPSMCGR